MKDEKPAPTRKNTDRPIRIDAVSAGSRLSRTRASTANQASVLNCRVRNAEAPSCTAAAMPCIFSVPWSAASTLLRSATAKPSATSAIAATTHDVGEVGAAQIERVTAGGTGEPRHASS